MPVDLYDAVGLRIRQRPQNQSINQREDGYVRADAERQREHRNSSEARRFAQHAEPEAYVVQHCFQQRYTAPLAHGFFRLLHAAELHQCRAPRLLWRHARTHVVRDVHFEVSGKFVAHITIELLFTEQAAQTVNQGANRLHRYTSLVSQRLKRMDFCRPPRRNPACQASDDQDQHHRSRKSPRIARRHAVQFACDHARGC